MQQSKIRNKIPFIKSGDEINLSYQDRFYILFPNAMKKNNNIAQNFNLKIKYY